MFPMPSGGTVSVRLFFALEIADGSIALIQLCIQRRGPDDKSQITRAVIAEIRSLLVGIRDLAPVTTSVIGEQLRARLAAGGPHRVLCNSTLRVVGVSDSWRPVRVIGGDRQGHGRGVGAIRKFGSLAGCVGTLGVPLVLHAALAVVGHADRGMAVRIRDLREVVRGGRARTGARVVVAVGRLPTVAVRDGAEPIDRIVTELDRASRTQPVA